jgi:hypothetical protein
MKKRVCIISFSPIHRDGRVLRQIKYLSPHYSLKVIGYGAQPEGLNNSEGIEWRQLNESKQTCEQVPMTILERLSGIYRAVVLRDWDTLRGKLQRRSAYLFYLGWLFPVVSNRWYWRKSRNLEALRFSMSSPCDAFLANNWESLPVAAEAAKMFNARVVFDAHEYAPLEYSNFKWRLIIAPMISYLLREYCNHVDAFATVGPRIAERYRREFNLTPIVVMNAPELTSVAEHSVRPERINLVHHGIASRLRRLEEMIKTVHLCHSGYHLHFILIGKEVDYIRELKELSEELAPGRVHFHEPVTPEQIVERISEYDIGFCFIAPTNYNYQVSLPNKFFDMIVAGLALVTGPSPEMADMVLKYGVGRIARSFKAADLSETLNELSVEEIESMRKASQEASKQVNAEKEMSKLVDAFRQVLKNTKEYERHDVNRVL